MPSSLLSSMMLQSHKFTEHRNTADMSNVISMKCIIWQEQPLARLMRAAAEPAQQIMSSFCKLAAVLLTGHRAPKLPPTNFSPLENYLLSPLCRDQMGLCVRFHQISRHNFSDSLTLRHAHRALSMGPTPPLPFTAISGQTRAQAGEHA